MLTASGQIEFANDVAQRLFERPTAGTRHSFLTAINIVAAMLGRALTAEEPIEPPVITLKDERSGDAYRVRAERILGADGQSRGLILFEPAALAASADTLNSLIQMGLTQREAEVTIEVLRGRTTGEIAAELVVSAHTVHDHLRKVFEKLGVNSRQQLATRLLSRA